MSPLHWTQPIYVVVVLHLLGDAAWKLPPSSHQCCLLADPQPATCILNTLHKVQPVLPTLAGELQKQLTLVSFTPPKPALHCPHKRCPIYEGLAANQLPCRVTQQNVPNALQNFALQLLHYYPVVHSFKRKSDLAPPVGQGLALGQLVCPPQRSNHCFQTSHHFCGDVALCQRAPLLLNGAWQFL